KDLRDACEQAEEKLRRRRRQLRGVAEALKTTDPQTAALRQKTAVEEYAALRRELIVLGSELRLAAKGRETGAAAAVPEAAGEQALDEHPDVQAQARKVEKAEELQAQFRMNAAPRYRGVGDPGEEVKAAREALAALRARLRRGIEAKLRRRAEAEAERLAAHREEREALL